MELARLAAALGAVLLVSCGPRVPLPEGDVTRGRATFVEMKCHECHTVAGDPTYGVPVGEMVPVALGGVRHVIPSPTEIATAIADPGRGTQGRPPNGPGPMPEFADRLTLRQVSDLAAYVSTAYVPEHVPHR